MNNVNVRKRKNRATRKGLPSGITSMGQKVVATRPTLSVCMIVKNEEKMLPACLESVRDLADELIIVDTGSTDHTIEIARAAGAVVHSHPWQNDFSLHRNQSLSYATGDWVLQIDADERLTKESRQRLRTFLRHVPPKTSGVMVTIRDFARNGELRSVWNYPRLFRNRAGVKYDGIVHNQVLVPGVLSFSDLAIDHFGYDLPPEIMRRKFRRTLTLLRKLHRQNPDDPFATYYLANIYSAYQRHRQAVAWSEKTLERLRALDQAPPHYLSVYFTIISSSIKLHCYKDAQKYCLEALQIYPRYLDAHYYLACLAFMAKQFAEAAEHCQHYFVVRDYLLSDPAHCSTMMHYTLHRSHWMEYYYGFSLLMKKQMTAGLRHLIAAVQQPYVKAGMIIEMVHNVLAISQLDAARKLVETALQTYAGKPEILLLLSRELLDAGLYIWIEELVGNWVSASEVDRGSPLVASLAKVICGKHEEAREILLHLPSDDQQDGLAMLLANQFDPDSIRGAIGWEEIVASLTLQEGKPAVAFAAAAWLNQRRRTAEVLRLKVDEHGETENLVLFQMQVVQAATVANEIDKLLEVLDKLLADAHLPKTLQLDSLSDLSQQFMKLAAFYKQNQWLDASTEAIRLAWWFDQSNASLQARYYTNLMRTARGFGNLSEIIRAVIREAVPKPRYQDPIAADELVLG